MSHNGPSMPGAAAPVRTLSGVKKAAARLVGFLGVGATGLTVNSALLIAFTEWAGLHYLWSAVAATQGSSLWNFTFHDRLVYRGRPDRKPSLTRLGSYLLMNNAALLVRGPLLVALVDWLGVNYVVGNLLSLVTLTGLRFLLSEFWIWPGSGGEVNARPARFTYRIHDILTVKSEIALKELSFFQVDGLEGPPDLSLRIGRPADSAARDFLVYHDGLGSLGFKLWISRDEPLEIWASPLVGASPHVLYTNVVEPVLRWAVVRNGYALVHGATIAFEGRAALITAPTDTGKTTTVLRAIESQSWSFLADDMSLLDRSGRILCYPKPMTISMHTLKAVRVARLTLPQRLALPIQSRLHSREGRQIGLWMARIGLPAATLNALVQWLIPPPKYTVEVLLPGAVTASEARLEHVVILARGEEGEERVGHGELVRSLRRNADDAYGFPPYADLVGFLSQWEGRDLHEIERDILFKATRRCPATRLASQEYLWWSRLPSVFRPPRPWPRNAAKPSAGDALSSDYARPR